MKIWAYWNSSVRTKLIEECINTWNSNILYNNELNEIYILNDENLNEYVDTESLGEEFYKFTPTLKSDLIRLYLIYKHGGIWFDISTKMNEKWNLPICQKDEYYCFYKNDYFPENFCIFSPIPKNKNIKKILDLLIDVTKKHPDYNKHHIYDIVKKTKGYNSSYMCSNENYFMFFFSYSYLTITDKNFQKAKKFNENFSFYPGFFESPGMFSSPGVLTKFTSMRRKFYENRYFIYLILVFILFLFIFSCYYWFNTIIIHLE